jgi:hypothetical protein
LHVVQLVKRLVGRLVAWLVVDHFASRRLDVDYFDYAARPVARVQLVKRLVVDYFAWSTLVVDYFASRRLVVDYFDYACLRLLRHIARLIVDYFASHRLVVDYFAYTARPGASARCAACRAARRRLPRFEQARRRLLRLHHASECLGT